MRVLVTGSRLHEDANLIATTLRLVNPSVVIHGGAQGADLIANAWAQDNRLDVVCYPAIWKRGKRAGVLRNIFMLEDSHPDLVLAFPLEGSIGTWHMVDIARAHGVEVQVFG